MQAAEWLSCSPQHTRASADGEWVGRTLVPLTGPWNLPPCRELVSSGYSAQLQQACSWRAVTGTPRLPAWCCPSIYVCHSGEVDTMQSLEPSVSWIWYFFRTPTTAIVMMAHHLWGQGRLPWPGRHWKYFPSVLVVVCSSPGGCVPPVVTSFISVPFLLLAFPLLAEWKETFAFCSVYYQVQTANAKLQHCLSNLVWYTHTGGRGKGDSL